MVHSIRGHLFLYWALHRLQKIVRSVWYFSLLHPCPRPNYIRSNFTINFFYASYLFLVSCSTVANCEMRAANDIEKERIILYLLSNNTKADRIKMFHEISQTEQKYLRDIRFFCVELFVNFCKVDSFVVPSADARDLPS